MHIKKIISHLPIITLFILVTVNIISMMFSSSAGIKPWSELVSNTKTLLENPRETLREKKYRWSLDSYSDFISDNVAEGSGVLFVGDRTDGNGVIPYYVIYTYTEKNIIYNFDYKKPSSTEDIINKMRNSDSQYVFSFENQSNLYDEQGVKEGETLLLKLVNNQLVVWKKYG